MTPVRLLDAAAGFRGMAADSLRVAGFEPTGGRHTVAEAEALVLRGPVRSEALVLDVNLPDGGGCALCARLRAVRQRMPVLMLGRPGCRRRRGAGVGGRRPRQPEQADPALGAGRPSAPS